MSDSMDGFWISWLLFSLIGILLLLHGSSQLRRGQRLRRPSFEYYRWLDMINVARIVLGRPVRKELTADDERRIGQYRLLLAALLAVFSVIAAVALVR